jgi:thiamine transport system substrate-binding protein
MLGPAFQADVPLSMYVFPANATASVPDVFAQHAAHVAAPLTLAPAQIDANRERWIDEWTEIVLR